MIDDCPFVEAGIGEFGDRDREDAIAPADPVDVRRDRAAVSDLVGRRFDLRLGRKGDGEGVLRIGVLLPILRGSGAADGERCHGDGDNTHGFLLAR